jgi:hypothetical protein
VSNTCSKLMLQCLFSFFVTSLVATGFIQGQSEPSNAKGTTITSFESSKDVQKLKLTNARMSLTTEHVTDGKSALEVEFTRPGTASIDLTSGSPPWDWRSFGAIALDVTNPADKEISVGLQLSDAGTDAGAAHQVSGHGNVAPHDTVCLLLSDWIQFVARTRHAGWTAYGSGNDPVQ